MNSLCRIDVYSEVNTKVYMKVRQKVDSIEVTWLRRLNTYSMKGLVYSDYTSRNYNTVM